MSTVVTNLHLLALARMPTCALVTERVPLQSLAPDLAVPQDAMQPPAVFHASAAPGAVAAGRQDAPATVPAAVGAPAAASIGCSLAGTPAAAAHYGSLATEHGAALLSLATAAGMAGAGLSVGVTGGAMLFPEALAQLQACASMPAFGASGVPPLLSQLPHHLQSWLQVPSHPLLRLWPAPRSMLFTRQARATVGDSRSCMS